MLGVEKGTYALVIALKSDSAFSVGKLCRGNDITFPAGHYIYFGSAQGGLYARVSRHLRREKRYHWHIDYLLQFATVVEIWYSPEGEHAERWERKERLECLWFRVARDLPQGQIPVPGFGSSDCRCKAHLIYFPAPPSFGLFLRMLEERGHGTQRASAQDFMDRVGT